MDVNILTEEDDKVKQALKYKILEQKNKLFYNINKSYGTPETEFETTFIKGHKKAITDMKWMPGNKKIVTASKDCNLIMWDIESKSKSFFKGEKFNRGIAGHFDEVMACAVSRDGKFLVSGGKDRIVRVWDIHNQKQI
jgi:ribosomal RNA-processing protein 9